MSYYQKIRRQSENMTLAATESVRRPSALLVDPLETSGDRKLYVHELKGRSRNNSFKIEGSSHAEDTRVHGNPGISIGDNNIYENQLQSIRDALQQIDRHQLPQDHASEGQVLMHIARINDTKKSKQHYSWPRHNLPTSNNSNAVWNQQRHKSEYTFRHVKHPKPALLKKNLARRRRSMDFLKDKLRGSTELDDRQHYVSIVRQNLEASNHRHWH